VLGLVVLVASAACTPTTPTTPTSSTTTTPSTTACNGADVLCGRAFDAVAHLTTHNAMSAEAYGFIAPNQTRSFTGQLDAGVRALMLDVHRNADSGLPSPNLGAEAIALCHGYCAFGAIPLTAGLTEIRAWLDAHPREVVTLILENYVSAAALETSFADAGLLPLLATHTTGAAWPTLGQMIDSGRRVVVLTDSQGGQRPWLLPVFSEAWDTDFSAATTADFTCDVLRGSFSNRLIILNHFLSDPLPSPLLADQANAASFLPGRVADCRAEWGGRLPNFVTVDFFERGVAAQVVADLNGT